MVTMAEGKHPDPYRTRQLSPQAPMVLRGGTRGRVGRCHVPALLLFVTFMPLKEML